MRRSLSLSLALAALPAAAAAAPTVTCHCFRERSYDPARPTAADDYILATTRSSLLSASLSVPKGDLVRAVMTGASPDDLWIAHWSAARTGRTAAWLLGSLSETGSWRASLAGTEGLPPTFLEALGRNEPPSGLAALAVDDVLATRLGAGADALRSLRKAGASSAEVALAIFLAKRLATPAPELLARQRSGRAPWGALLHDAGLEPEGIDAAIRAAVR
jgi:hypothetical protein